MGKQYKGFSKQEHDEVSAEINEISERLYSLSKKIIPAYGVSSAVGKEIERLVRGPGMMIGLKTALDNAYANENGSIKDSPYL